MQLTRGNVRKTPNCFSLVLADPLQKPGCVQPLLNWFMLTVGVVERGIIPPCKIEEVCSEYIKKKNFWSFWCAQFFSYWNSLRNVMYLFTPLGSNIVRNFFRSYHWTRNLYKLNNLKSLVKLQWASVSLHLFLRLIFLPMDPLLSLPKV